MEEMVEGTRLHPQRDNTWIAEVIINREVIWRQHGFPSQRQAQDEASRQLALIKQRR